MGDRLKNIVKQEGKGLLGMKALAHRKYVENETRIYPKSWWKTIEDDALGIAALKYTLSMGADALVPPGNFEQFSFAVSHIDECLKNPLSASELAYLKEEAAKIGDHFIFD